jgi:hypothetical protein
MRILAGAADSRHYEEARQPVPKERRDFTKELAMAHRGIASLALALMMSFLLLAYFDSQLFFIHLYESGIYLAIIAMLFCVGDRWTYMLGIVAPALWLALMLTPGACAVVFFNLGGIPGIFRPLQLVFRLPETTVSATVVGTVILILSAWMSLFCAIRWGSEFAGQGKGRNTFLVCLSVAGLYYGSMVLWALRQLATVA